MKRLEKGVDWHRKVSQGFQIPEGVRGLGAIEGNESNLFSDRMKDRGMSWTISGAQNMGKAIQLSFNGELAMWCGRSPKKTERESLSFRLFDELDSYKDAIPALTGPHASRPWVKTLRRLSFPHCP